MWRTTRRRLGLTRWPLSRDESSALAQLLGKPREERTIRHQFGIWADGGVVVDLGPLPEGLAGHVRDGRHPVALLCDAVTFRAGGVGDCVPFGPPGEDRELQGAGHALKRVNEQALPL